MELSEIEEQDIFIKLFAKGILGGRSPVKMSLSVCLPLGVYLFRCGIFTFVIVGEVTTAGKAVTHYWLQLEDKRIIDAVAGQFKNPNGENMPSVYIGKIPDWYKRIEIISQYGKLI